MTIRRRAIPHFILTVLLTLSALSATARLTDEYPRLRESIDPVMQRQLEQLIRDQGLQQITTQERLAIALVDITDPNQPRMAAINGDVMEYAASLPKIAILLAAFVQIEQRKLVLTEELEDDLTVMIRYSSNEAATRVLDLVGREELLRIVQSPRFMLYDRQYDGGLWVGKAYARQGAYQRDPLNRISHGATAIQGARFYYLLATNRLVGPDLTARMKEMLSRPAINHKFVKGLKARPGLKFFRKSGTWKQFHADSMMVEYGHRRFIMVGLAEGARGGQWLERLATPLFDLVVSTAPEK
ncbi:MAG: serine hydrolase [Gammaproteobacteria bacterium]|nr:serine hydrolase [Gammaproteobacteria bacterium]